MRLGPGSRRGGGEVDESTTTESGNHKRRSTDRRNGAVHAFLRQSVQLQSVQLWLIFSTFGLVNDRRGMYRDRNDLLRSNGVWVSGLHAPVFSSRHLLATVISRACVDPREGCSLCHVSGHGRHQPRTAEDTAPLWCTALVGMLLCLGA